MVPLQDISGLSKWSPDNIACSVDANLCYLIQSSCSVLYSTPCHNISISERFKMFQVPKVAEYFGHFVSSPDSAAGDQRCRLLTFLAAPGGFSAFGAFGRCVQHQETSREVRIPGGGRRSLLQFWKQSIGPNGVLTLFNTIKHKHVHEINRMWQLDF